MTKFINKLAQVSSNNNEDKMSKITLKDLIQIKKIPGEDGLFLIVQTPEMLKKHSQVDGFYSIDLLKLNKRIKAERIGDSFAILYESRENVFKTSKYLSKILSENEIKSLKNPKEDLAYRIVDNIRTHSTHYKTMCKYEGFREFYCAIIQLYKKLA